MLVGSDVLGHEQGLVSWHLGSDLELDSVLDWLLRVVEALSVY